MRASSPSNCSEAFGVLASRTKWLSQCGQYSSLPLHHQHRHHHHHRTSASAHSRILELTCILAKRLLALFAYKGHVEGLHERVVTLLLVALCTVEPFFAWPWSANIASFMYCTSPGCVLVDSVQHGERMDTWAFRTCLLPARQPSAAGVRASCREQARVLTT